MLARLMSRVQYFCKEIDVLAGHIIHPCLYMPRSLEDLSRRKEECLVKRDHVCERGIGPASFYLFIFSP